MLGSTASSQSELYVCINLTHSCLPDRPQENWEQICSTCQKFLWLQHEREGQAELFWKQVTESHQEAVLGTCHTKSLPWVGYVYPLGYPPAGRPDQEA
jgi:hypothetical protein